MDLIQSNGQPQYGRFNAIPTRIDYQAVQYKTEQGVELLGWRKRLKYKKFKFCSIQHQHYRDYAADNPARQLNIFTLVGVFNLGKLLIIHSNKFCLFVILICAGG